MIGFGGMLLGGGPARDPYFANVSLLLQPTGSQADGTITDFSSNAFTMTKGGNTTTSNTTIYFPGTKSIVYDGTGDTLSVQDSALFTLNGPFTAQALVNFSGSAVNRRIFEQRTTNFNNGHALYTDSSAKLRYSLNSGGSSVVDIIGTTVMTTGTWYLLTLLFTGTNYSIYVNTTSNEANVNVATTPADYTSAFFVGSDASGTSDMNGAIASFRLTKDAARPVTALSSLTLFPTS